MRPFQAERVSVFRKWSNYLRSLKGYQLRKEYSTIDTLCLFIGYPRSGHTLIGSLLDAHPNAVIAHEMDSLYYFKIDYPLPQIYYLLMDNARQFTEQGRKWMGYHYDVKDQWQGRHKTIQVIGDKSGGRTSRRLSTPAYQEALRKTVEKTGIRLLFIHVTRNPYDVITTMVKRSTSRRDIDLKADKLDLKIEHFFKHADSIQALKQSNQYEMLDIKHEDFVSQPKKTLTYLCQQLKLDADEKYIHDCASLVWTKAKQSRHSIDFWTPDLIKKVKDRFDQYDFLQSYEF